MLETVNVTDLFYGSNAGSIGAASVAANTECTLMGAEGAGMGGWKVRSRIKLSHPIVIPGRVRADLDRGRLVFCSTAKTWSGRRLPQEEAQLIDEM